MVTTAILLLALGFVLPLIAAFGLFARMRGARKPQGAGAWVASQLSSAPGDAS